MQNAKDTFYEVLRGRLATVNPGRTVVVRGVARPGVLVTENELVTAQAPADCFAVRWAAVMVDARGAMPAITMTCEISYATAGTSGNGGMDRGRALAGMDAELLSALSEEPRNAAKMSYSAGSGDGVAATALGTRIWWGDIEFGEAKAVGDRMGRTATLPVMSFEEGGEL